MRVITKYNPLPFLLYAWQTTPDTYANYPKIAYLNQRLLDLGHCTQCEGTKEVEANKDCGKAASICCGGCTEMIECENCK